MGNLCALLLEQRQVTLVNHGDLNFFKFEKILPKLDRLIQANVQSFFPAGEVFTFDAGSSRRRLYYFTSICLLIGSLSGQLGQV